MTQQNLWSGLLPSLRSVRVGGKYPSFSAVCKPLPVGGVLVSRTSLLAALLLVSGCVGAADAPLPPDVTPYQLPTMTGDAPAD